MSLRALRALPLLLLAGLGVLCAEESPGPAEPVSVSETVPVSVPVSEPVSVPVSVPVPVPEPRPRRYSEATLASDYSRTMEHVLRRNFVEWLLARRERKRHDPAELLRREAATPQGAGAGERSDLGTPGAKGSPGWPRENREKPSFPAPGGSEGLREFLEQEFLTWLMSGELCGATAT